MRWRCERSAAVVLQWVKLCFLVIIIIGTALVQPRALAAHSDDDALIISNGTAHEPDFTICAALKKPYVYPSRLCELSAATSDNNIIMESFGSDDDIISNASSNLSCTIGSDPLALDISTFVNSFQGMDVELLQAIRQMAFPDSATIQVLVYRSRSAILVETRPGGLCDMSIGGLMRDSKASRPSNACSRPGSLDDLTEEDFCGITYSKSYYRDGLALVTREPKTDFTSMVLSVARNNSVLSVLSIIVLALLASGHLIWFLERKDNPGQFPSAYLDGVDDGLWWSVVTMTTVGYGDKTPTTVMGRALGVLWMFLGLGLFGFFNAVMIGEMGKRKPLLEVAGVSDPVLEGSKFCTHPENAWFLRHEAVLEDRILTTANITECYEKLLFEEVDVVLRDRMAILPDISDFVDNLPQKPQTWKTDHSAYSPLNLVSSGVAVSRLVGFTYFAAAFPQDGALQTVVSGAIQSLAAGHVVFGHDQDLFRGGWSLELAEHKYTMTTLKPTDGVHSTPHAPAISVSTQMLCSFAAISMAVYLVTQFGGLWFRMAWMKWRIRAGIMKEPDTGISFQNQMECPQLKELRELKLMHRKSVEIQEKQFNEGMDNLNKRIEDMREQHSKTIHEMSTAVRRGSVDNVRQSSTEKSRFSLHLPGGWTSSKKPPMKLAAVVPIGDNFLTAAPRVPSTPEPETERHHPTAGRNLRFDQKTQLEHHLQVSPQGLEESSLMMPNLVKSDDLRSGRGTRDHSGKGCDVRPDPSSAVLHVFADT